MTLRGCCVQVPGPSVWPWSKLRIHGPHPRCGGGSSGPGGSPARSPGQSASTPVASWSRSARGRSSGRRPSPTSTGSAGCIVGYEALVEDPQVEAVYVATPHSAHAEHALLAIAAGKHVLVEKAFTRNTAEAKRVFAAAKEAGSLRDGGDVDPVPARTCSRCTRCSTAATSARCVGVMADHGQNMRHHPATHRLHNRDLAGGALLDLGVYPVSFAHDLLGRPDRVGALGSLTDGGVDGQVTISLGFGERAQAACTRRCGRRHRRPRWCSARPVASRSPGTSTARRRSTWSTSAGTGGPGARRSRVGFSTRPPRWRGASRRDAGRATGCRGRGRWT